MKMLIVGGAGTIGQHLVNQWQDEHDIIIAGRNSGDIQFDLSNEHELQDALQKLPALDAIVCAAGEARWADFNQLSHDDYMVGINSKLMGQVNIVRYGLPKLIQGGSVTLTTGILADDPVWGTASAAMVNGALHSFVQAINLELKQGKRVNVVCPGLVVDSADRYKDYFPGHNPVPMNKVVNGYAKAVFGHASGQIIKIYE